MSESRASFWIVVPAYLVGCTALGLLALSALVPRVFEALGSTGVVLAQVIAVACLGVMGWQLVAHDGRVFGGLDEPERP